MNFTHHLLSTCIRWAVMAALLSSSLFLPLAHAQSSHTFQALLAEHWQWTLQTNPIMATALGERRYDTTLGELSVEAMDRDAERAKGFLKRLMSIDTKTLTEADRINAAVLRQTLQEQIEGNTFPQRLMLFTNRSGWISQLTNLPNDLPFFSRADYESYIARLKDIPRYNEQGIATTRKAIDAGAVQFCRSMMGYEESVSANIVSNAASSVFMQPFEKKPSTINDADWSALRTQALAVITDKVMPSLKSFLDFYLKDYQPKCRNAAGVSSVPQGVSYYAYKARSHTTTEYTPQQIHKIGLEEVARILAEMQAVVKRSGFKGTRAEFVNRMRTDPQFYASTESMLVERTSSLMKQVDGELPKLFSRLPRLPYTVKPMSADVAPGNTTAYYELGNIETGKSGVYRVNTTELNQRPLYELPALSLHEAVPGHHLQIALQQELDIPLFRRHAVSFTAFVEGWGLYSERLGIEMGLYDTPEKDYARLSYEMWRACRLVVDTGLHTMGWTREQAIAYMLDNTALSRTNVEAEVDRYITWPGQALAYKIGELKIRELRARAQGKLGNKFDIRKFHDAVLENGPLPLDALEHHVDAWIAQQA